MARQRAFNVDCMKAMEHIPDKYFDLAVVDPPYGDGGANSKTTTEPDSEDGLSDTRQVNHAWGGGSRDTRVEPASSREIQQVYRTGGTWAAKYAKKIISWDYAPSEEYFQELFRVSKEQIIWGGNYFRLPPTRMFLVWRKTQIPEQFSMAMAEYAWCSFNGNAKVFDCSSAGQEGRFHPTQKPKALYGWIYNKYAKPGFKILDTHMGSGSSRLAAYDANLEYVGFEIDKYYFDRQEERWADYIAQVRFEFEGGTES